MAVTQTVQLKDLVSPQLGKIQKEIEKATAGYEALQKLLATSTKGAGLGGGAAGSIGKAASAETAAAALSEKAAKYTERAAEHRAKAIDAELKAQQQGLAKREAASAKIVQAEHAAARAEEQASLRRLVVMDMVMRNTQQIADMAGRAGNAIVNAFVGVYNGTEQALNELTQAQLLREKAFATWGSSKIATGSQVAGAEKAFMSIEDYVNGVYTASNRLKGQLDLRQTEKLIQTFGMMGRASGVGSEAAGRALEQMLQGAAVGKLSMVDLRPILQQFPQIAQLFAEVNKIDMATMMDKDFWDTADFNPMLQRFAELGPAAAAKAVAGLEQTPDIIAQNFKTSMYDAYNQVAPVVQTFAGEMYNGIAEGLRYASYAFDGWGEELTGGAASMGQAFGGVIKDAVNLVAENGERILDTIKFVTENAGTILKAGLAMAITSKVVQFGASLASIGTSLAKSGNSTRAHSAEIERNASAAQRGANAEKALAAATELVAASGQRAAASERAKAAAADLTAASYAKQATAAQLAKAEMDWLEAQTKQLGNAAYEAAYKAVELARAEDKQAAAALDAARETDKLAKENLDQAHSAEQAARKTDILTREIQQEGIKASAAASKTANFVSTLGRVMGAASIAVAGINMVINAMKRIGSAAGKKQTEEITSQASTAGADYAADKEAKLTQRTEAEIAEALKAGNITAEEAEASREALAELGKAAAGTAGELVTAQKNVELGEEVLRLTKEAADKSVEDGRTATFSDLWNATSELLKSGQLEDWLVNNGTVDWDTWADEVARGTATTEQLKWLENFIEQNKAEVPYLTEQNEAANKAYNDFLKDLEREVPPPLYEDWSSSSSGESKTKAVEDKLDKVSQQLQWIIDLETDVARNTNIQQVMTERTAALNAQVIADGYAVLDNSRPSVGGMVSLLGAARGFQRVKGWIG